MILELIHYIVGIYNIKYNYVEKDDLWLVILAAAEVSIFYNTNRLTVILWDNWYLDMIWFSWLHIRRIDI